MSQKEKIASNIHRKIQPIEFYRKFLDKNVRPDGRYLTKSRSTLINSNSLSTTDASAVVKIGSTTIVSGIKLEIAAPRSPHVKQGFIEIDVIFDPICTLQYHSINNYESDTIKHKASSLSRKLCDIIVESGMFSLENLCIESEKAVWVLYIDLLCICNDGNLFDACLLSIVTALKTLKIPHTCLGKDDDTIYIDNRNKNNFYKLTLNYDLLPLTFGILDKKIIVDPTLDEETLLSDIINIVLNNNGDIIHLYKSGQKNIDFDILENMINLAKERANQLIKILDMHCINNKQEIDFKTELKLDQLTEKKENEYDEDNDIYLNMKNNDVDNQ
eukprot:522377_1